jgi:hypothetical protein
MWQLASSRQACGSAAGCLAAQEVQIQAAWLAGMLFKPPNCMAGCCLQVAGVQYTLDTVVQALTANPARKFVYGEMVRSYGRWLKAHDDLTGLRHSP